MKMSKQWKIAGIVTLSLLGLTACEKDQVSGLSAIDDNEICIDANIQEVQTRATGSAFATGDQVGVYVVEYLNNNTDRGELQTGIYKNMKLTYNSSSWTAESKMYWQSEKQVDVIGYYPYNQSLVESTLNAYPWTIDVIQDTNEKMLKGDFLWAQKVTLPRSNAVPLTFKHMMTKVVINYKLGEGFTAFPQNMPIKVQTMNGVSTTVNLKTGEVTPATRETSYRQYQMLETQNPSAGVVLRQEAIMIPQTMRASDEFIVMTVPDLGLFKYTLPSDMELKSGWEYTFDITLTKGGIQVAVGGIQDWTQPGRPSTGQATAVVPPVTANVDDAVNDYWDRISVTNKEEILIHYGKDTATDNPCIYFKPEGQDQGYTITFDKDGYPEKLLLGQQSSDKTLAVFVPDLTSTPKKLGVGLITKQDRDDADNGILMNKVDIPASIPNGTYPEKLKDLIDVLVELVEKNNLTQQIPPSQFGQGSEILDNLLEELEQETEQPTYTGGGSSSGGSTADTALNDSINSLLGNQTSNGTGGAGTPMTPDEAQGHLNSTETSSTTGMTEAEEEFREDIQMVESGVQGGFGDVKVTLTWNNAGDTDLFLKDPQSHIIYYNNRLDKICGANLDLDNRDGFGTGKSNKPENIFYPENKGPKGTYYIKVLNYESGTRDYTLYIYAFGRTKTYRGTITGNYNSAGHYYKFEARGMADVTFSDGKISGQSW